MKKLTSKLTAIFAAAAITLSAAGISAYAKTEKEKYTGWVSGEIDWQYMSNGSPYERKSREIDGVVYDFSYNGYCIGKYTGQRTENGVKRRYSEGLPYTGWTKSKDGSRKYYLDGYLVTEDFQIGNKVYSFGEDGVYTGKSRSLTLTASCESRVSSDAEKLYVTVAAHDKNGRDYAVGEPEKMERWENGKWVSCIGKDVEYAVDGIGYVLSGIEGQCEPNDAKTTFYPQTYTGGNMPAGYYRIALMGCEFGNYSETKREIYAVFEAVPPVELKTSEEVYLSDGYHDTTINIIAEINSKKDTLKTETAANGVTLEIQKKTAAGWEVCENHDCVVGYTDKENELEIVSDFAAEAGYYRAVVTVGGEEYTAAFRVDTLTAVPWLDEYSLKNEHITVSFTVCSKYCKPVNIREDIISLYKRENGKWEHISGAQIVDIEPDSISYTTLEPGEKTALTFDLTSYYDASKLKAGDYAVYIEGAGFAEFRLTDKAQRTSEFPFANLEYKDIKEVDLIYYECGTDETYKVSFIGGEDLVRSLNCLRQLKFESVIENYSNNSEGGGSFEVVVRLKSGGKKTLLFCESDAVIYNGVKVYKCGKYAYSALYDFLVEKSGMDKDYYGYRRT